MKKIIFLILIPFFFLTACKKETKNVSQVVDAVYPTITLKGEEVVSTTIGSGDYQDPGATGFDNLTKATSELTPVSNTVDLTTPGFYSVQYSMSNGNGFVTTKSRLVLVTQADPATDLSGTYARSSNGQEVTVTRVGTGLYITDNVGGVADDELFLFPIYFGQTYLDSVAIPVQPNPLGGNISSIPHSGVLSISSSDTTFQYVIKGSGFAESTRVFSHNSSYSC